ncbi:TVG0907198 [Thermoplasma volcanium GSS1]|uniref:TVG0907198 protein n=1 Tax=Thermoplasma volcanium (strain ATCC 51530 / DSM 4299 / JCM 9571 / NBRC 15438 / GSS1) TaxID=273116 RepID=Q97AC1_THEVO|nr:TVG0907198 [Thermoplasma volcanium GSS1]
MHGTICGNVFPLHVSIQENAYNSGSVKKCYHAHVTSLELMVTLGNMDEVTKEASMETIDTISMARIQEY